MNSFTNHLKTFILMLGLTGLLMLVGSFWGSHGMILMLGIAVIMNFVAWFFSDKIAIASMRGQEIDERTAPELYGIVARLAARAGVPMPRVFVCPHPAPNAFATGRNPRHAAVAVTQGALRLLDHDELEGVLAHELAHIRSRDTLTSAMAATLAGVFSMLAHPFFLLGGGNREGGHPLAAIGAVLLGLIGAALIKAMISRTREYAADAQGAVIAGTPLGLVSALQKLESVARHVPLENPNPAMNTMFIVEPFVGRAITELFASHPPVEKRVAALLGKR